MNIDGIQINSYKGSTVEYGAMNKFYISNGGTYPVPYDSTGLKVDLEKLPKFDITGTNESGTSTTITLSNTSSKKLIRLSSSIKSINFNNRGIIAASRNYGVKLSSYPYIAFLDSDDFFEKDKIKKVVKFFNENKSSDIVFDLSLIHI